VNLQHTSANIESHNSITSVTSSCY